MTFLTTGRRHSQPAPGREGRSHRAQFRRLSWSRSSVSRSCAACALPLLRSTNMTSNSKTNISRTAAKPGEDDRTKRGGDPGNRVLGGGGNESDGNRTSGKSSNQGENPGGGDRNKGAGDHGNN